ncbi:MAG: putative hydrolase of the superfamily [Actinomycetota bacterium]|nr:putative hydrolase of the superfamily [Actinomycetota bacterium]
MALRIRDRVVVFDYGEVISRSPTDADRAAILAAAGAVPADEFWQRYWQYRDELDRGTISVIGYWERIASDLGARWGAADIQSLWAADFRSWISVEPGTVELLDELHAGGTRVALLSNAGFDFAGPFRFSPMARYFERVFISAELDELKPEAQIYLRVMGELGISPAQMVFIDNKSANTDAAAALGITVHHFVGVDDLAEFLRSLVS